MMDLVSNSKFGLNLYTILITCVLVCSCGHTDHKIIKYVQSTCLDNNDTCEIDLQKALNVKYEVMYLFGEYTQADDISAVMGIEYFRKKSIVDSHKRIILLRDNKIVYEDDFSTLYLRFSEITEKVDTVNKNNPYLVHYGSRYKLIRDINDNSKYFLEPLSDSTQYERYDYTWDKGYKFKKRTK